MSRFRDGLRAAGFGASGRLGDEAAAPGPAPTPAVVPAPAPAPAERRPPRSTGREVAVALDGLGGDRAPEEPVKGARAAASANLKVLLVGDERVLHAELERQGGDEDGRIEIVHAADVIGSEEEGARAVRAKPDSSMVQACRMVSEGRAEAVVSAGNTGAMLASATLHLRRVPGVIRPAIAVVLPSAAGPIVLIDAGANADIRAEYLPQFALMGRLLAQDVLGIGEPTVGLLSIGEEAGKGSEVVKAAYAAMRDQPGFVGNVEGRDIPLGLARVVVTDGFTGNVALKLYEGSAAFLFGEIRTALGSTTRARIGGALIRPALRTLRDKINPEEYGGAYLLGVRGLTVIAHGNSGGAGIANAIRLGARGARGGLIGQLERGLRGARADTPAT